jgi:hypothetical protein
MDSAARRPRRVSRVWYLSHSEPPRESWRPSNEPGAVHRSVYNTPSSMVAGRDSQRLDGCYIRVVPGAHYPGIRT